MILKLINLIILIICVMISIAFFTLMERKMISYIQNRKGPNKVSIIGILQPIADAIKLISKELNLNLKSNFLLYIISPMLNILISLTMWMTFPFIFCFSFMKMSVLFMISCLSINSITIIMMSWSSNSNYAFMGMIRSVAQLISYEINFMLIVLTVINITEQLNFNFMEKLQKYVNLSEIIPLMLIMWLVSSLAETSRTPFDFSEGESELVSGFNIEYSSKSFMFLFLAEYANILFMSFITISMILMSQILLISIILYLFIAILFIWMRATLPRFRYDKLMKFNWSQLLPITTVLFFLSFLMKMH
uniref:NADH dehydrogenase subunit 2 n=1 Tax=Pealius machili TaxID=2829201 RepID=UPI001BED6A60|nr:NADH dehydrogenase subunit 2 [Pealius machili]QUA05867.1 NADH dehydrogenase subunit 2 [Pealius machili]